MKKSALTGGIVVFFTSTALCSYITNRTLIPDSQFDRALKECQQNHASLAVDHYEVINGISYFAGKCVCNTGYTYNSLKETCVPVVR